MSRSTLPLFLLLLPLVSSSPAIALNQPSPDTREEPPVTRPSFHVAWNPPPNRYLLAICLYGRLTNQIMCMRSYLRLAQVLNRTLLIPTWGVALNWQGPGIAYEFPWDTPIDWRRMRTCLSPLYGDRAVMTAAEYLKLNNKSEVQVTFYRGLTHKLKWAYPEGLNMREFQHLNRGILRLPERSSIPEEPIMKEFVESQPRGERGAPHPADVIQAVGDLQDDVITFGEMFTFDMQPGPEPLRVEDLRCGNLWRPHPDIMRFVEGAVDTLLGGEYAALHLRRGDFYKYRSHSGKIRGKELEEKEGFVPIVGYAATIKKKLQQLNITRLFVASNARNLEIDLFKAIVQEPEQYPKIEVALTLEDILKRKSWLHKQPWAKGALNLEQRPGSNGLVFSLIDKFMCVKAKTFWGSPGSSFSLEVDARLRAEERRFK